MLSGIACIYFLLAIGDIESSGGLNTNHVGPAMGVYGLMPAVISDTTKRHPEILLYNGDRQYLIANAHCRFLYDRYNGNMNKMAYAWFYGPYNYKFSVHNWYVKRFIKQRGIYGF